MKPFIPYSLIAAFAACGLASAQTATTTPVGYETLELAAGTNYIGLRLHEETLLAGTVDSIDVDTLTDAAVDFDSVLVGGANTFYILEIDNGSGAIQELTGLSGNNTELTLTEDITGLVSPGDSYRIRKAATLESVFGASNEAGLAPGFFGTAGADLVSVPNGLGGFDDYYYDEDQTTWAKSDASPVAPSEIPLIYADGIVMTMTAPLDLVVTGEVKTTSVLHFAASGTNYLSSVFPAGATLESAFGAPTTIATLDAGFFGTAGADLFLIPDGAGGFDTYYYDEDQTSWASEDATPVDASTVDLPSGFVFVNEGGDLNLLNSAPAGYENL